MKQLTLKHLEKAFNKRLLLLFFRCCFFFFVFFLLPILEPSIESTLKKFNDTVLHTAECMTQTICFKTGAEQHTNKWFDCERVTKKEEKSKKKEKEKKKRDARRAVSRFKRTKSDVHKLVSRQSRAEYKSNVTEEKQHYKTSSVQEKHCLTISETSLHFGTLFKWQDERKQNNQNTDKWFSFSLHFS